MTLDFLNTLFLGTQAIVMVTALTLTVREYGNVKRENRIKAYNETVDRMYSIRKLLIQEPDLHKLFEGSAEGDALQQIDHKHFYLVKMLLHMNESLFLRFFEQGKVCSDGNLYDPWRANLIADLSAPHVREIWDVPVVQNSFSASFREEVERLIAKHQRESVSESAHS